MDPVSESQSAPDREMLYPDSAYGSSAMDTDTDDGHTPPTKAITYDEELMHKVCDSAPLLVVISRVLLFFFCFH